MRQREEARHVEVFHIAQVKITARKPLALTDGFHTPLPFFPWYPLFKDYCQKPATVSSYPLPPNLWQAVKLDNCS